jgi:hypothetical protein
MEEMKSIVLNMKEKETELENLRPSLRKISDEILQLKEA